MIFITGATGFIGSEIVARFLKDGVSPSELVLLGRRKPIRGASMFAKRLREHGLDEALIDHLNWQKADLSETAIFTAALEALKAPAGSVVVHCAAIIHREGSAAEQERVNVGATRDLLRWTERIGGRFFFFSSVVSFGGSIGPEVRSEKDFPSVANAGHDFDYYATKHEAHMMIVNETRVPTLLFCPAIVHGALENAKNSRSHLKALRDGRLNLAPSGGCNIVGVDRVALAVVEAARRPTPELLKVGAHVRLLIDENLSFREYFQRYVQLARGDRAQTVHAVPAAAGAVARLVHHGLRALGRRVSAIEALAQGSLWLYFRSEYPMPATRGVWAAIQDSLNDPEPSKTSENL